MAAGGGSSLDSEVHAQGQHSGEGTEAKKLPPKRRTGHLIHCKHGTQGVARRRAGPDTGQPQSFPLPFRGPTTYDSHPRGLLRPPPQLDKPLPPPLAAAALPGLLPQPCSPPAQNLPSARPACRRSPRTPALTLPLEPGGLLGRVQPTLAWACRVRDPSLDWAAGGSPGHCPQILGPFPLNLRAPHDTGRADVVAEHELQG